jgi:uncharacterized coiled-coil protein SlyX
LGQQEVLERKTGKQSQKAKNLNGILAFSARVVKSRRTEVGVLKQKLTQFSPAHNLSLGAKMLN